MPNNLYNDAHDVNRITPVVLYQFDFSKVPALKSIPVSSTVYATNNANDDNSNLTFNLIEYDYIGIEGEGFFSDLSGEYSTPELTIDRERFEATTEFQSVKNYWTVNLGNTSDVPWVGCVVKRIFTAKTYSDTFADLNRLEQRYVVENVLEKTKRKWILKLTVSLALDADNILDRKLSSGYCTLRYRIPKADGIQATASISSVGGSGEITGLTITNAGVAYDEGTHPIKTSGGSGAVLLANADTAGNITSITISDDGSGYAPGNTLTIAPPFYNTALTDGGCPYGQDTSIVDGFSYFKQAGPSTTNHLQDYCGKRITDCVSRFDPSEAGNALPFYGTLKAGTKKTETE
jgi:phage-related protein